VNQYETFLRHVLENGVESDDRTGVGTISYFGGQIRFNLREGFPLITTKKVPFRWVAEELFWFVSGSTYEPELSAKGVDIWKEWATKEQCNRFGRKKGELGPVYGHQLRNFGAWHENNVDGEEMGDEAGVDGYYPNGVDQLTGLVSSIINNPNSRRHVVSLWNPSEVDDVALPPCHTLFQVRVIRGALSCHMYQRSADLFLGAPFNIASYALLTHLLAHVCGLGVGDLVISFGDAHVYKNHVDQVRLQLTREPRPYPSLSLVEDAPTNIQCIEFEHLKLEGYDPHPAIKADVAI